jgi:hypothetical protein
MGSGKLTKDIVWTDPKSRLFALKLSILGFRPDHRPRKNLSSRPNPTRPKDYCAHPHVNTRFEYDASANISLGLDLNPRTKAGTRLDHHPGSKVRGGVDPQRNSGGIQPCGNMDLAFPRDGRSLGCTRGF